VDAAKNQWWKAFLSIAYGSGLRRNETLHLTWMDIDFDNQRINVTAKKATEELLEWEPKNRKNRVVPMSDETVGLLVDMQVKACEGHPYIFVSPERLDRIKKRRKIGKWNSTSELINDITYRFTKIRCRANVAKCTIHDLRRSAITNWAQHLPIQVVQELAGHADIKTTREFYLTVRPEDFELASKVLQKVMAKTNDN
jgi:integrase